MLIPVVVAKARPVLHASMRPAVLCDWTYTVKNPPGLQEDFRTQNTVTSLRWNYPDQVLRVSSFLLLSLFFRKPAPQSDAFSYGFRDREYIQTSVRNCTLSSSSPSRYKNIQLLLNSKPPAGHRVLSPADFYPEPDCKNTAFLQKPYFIILPA